MFTAVWTLAATCKTVHTTAWARAMVHLTAIIIIIIIYYAGLGDAYIEIKLN